MNRPSVGVKLPVSGVGCNVPTGVVVVKGVLDAIAVDVDVAFVVGNGVSVASTSGVADGVDSNAGPSAAETTNVFEMVLKIPVASLHFKVTLCSPGSRFFGGLHFQTPLESVATTADCSSDST